MDVRSQTRIEDLPLVLRMPHLQAIMHCSKTKAYELVHTRGFPIVRVGRSIRIPRDAFLRWLEAETGTNDWEE
jgi:excisionase family DNA binding protein